MKAKRILTLGLATIVLYSCATGTPPARVAPLTSTPAPSPPGVGMWLHPDVELGEWMCRADTNLKNSHHYVHSMIQPSAWRQVFAHSSVVVLNNFIFAEPLPWSVFQNTRNYDQYMAEFQAYPANSPEGQWFRRLNDNVRTPLTELTHSGDPISQKTIYIYAHLFGYDRAHAISLGLTPMAEHSYAWPPKGLDHSWPASFLYDDDAGAEMQPRPSFKKLETRAAMANAVYFFMKHFEDVGAKVHLSPWREINGYTVATGCLDDDNARCGLDTWQDLYDTYQTIVTRVGEGGFDPTRIAVYPTVQLESFFGVKNRCVGSPVIDTVKQFYTRNVISDVPFAIGLSTYPASDYNGLEAQRSKLLHLLDNLDSSTPVECAATGIAPAGHITDVRVPRTTPLTIGETSRPSWLTFQALDTPSMMANERLGATLANTYFHYEYRAIDGTPSYPLEFVAFALGPNWVFPVEGFGMNFWLTTGSGVARNWLTPMQPLAGQLVLDAALDPDGDWDNDGVASITFQKNPFVGKRDVRRGLDDFLYELVPGPGSKSIKQRTSLEDITYTMDNCPYLSNSSQADADGDGIGDVCDNCKNVANYPQEDWDQDGFGSACDPDVNNDGLIEAEVDLEVVKQCQGAAVDCLAYVTFPDLPPSRIVPDLKGEVALIADMDADEDVDADDVVAWQKLASNAALRESGLACAGTRPCPDPAVVRLRNGQTSTIPDPEPKQRTCNAR